MDGVCDNVDVSVCVAESVVAAETVGDNVCVGSGNTVNGAETVFADTLLLYG